MTTSKAGNEQAPGAPDPSAAVPDGDTNARIHRLTQLYRALSEVNQAIIRMSDENELFPLVCRTAVEFGGVSMAWIGQADPESEQIVPVACYGTDTSYLNTIRVSMRQNTPEGQGPSAQAYHGNRIVVMNDWANSPMAALQPEAASLFLWGSSGCFPVQRKGRPFAVLSVYHKDGDFFDQETTDLLDEMSRDITFALDNFDREQERRKALEALSDSEQRFRAYFERSMFGMAATRADKTWIEVNQALCDMLGYTAEELMQVPWDRLTHPDDMEESSYYFRQMLDGTINEFVIEKRYLRKSGDSIDVHMAARGVRNEDGSLAYAVSLFEDISLRKMAERREKMRRQTLERVARGCSLPEIMQQVINSAEAIYPQSMCSILLITEDGEHLTCGAAPSLPPFFSAAINGIRIGMGVGSCGTAAFSGKRTIVEDIATHPYWEKYRELATSAGLGSCWSEPIHSSSGSILGTFAIYRHHPCQPDDHEIALIESAANLLGIAIERSQAEEELHLAASIYSNSSEAVLVTDAHNHIVALNPAFTQITGYTLDEIEGREPSILRSGRHDAEFFQTMWDTLGKNGYWQGEIWNRRKNGETYPEWLTINAIRNDQGEIQRYVSMGSDITSKIRSDELIWRQANYDFLTDLPNRYMFQDRLEQEIRHAKRENTRLALLFIDLDHFKDVNDTLGHPTGDQLLICAAERINRCVRGTDTVARMGGDEFTVILRDLIQTMDAEKIAEQIICELAAPYVINGESIYVSASIGITFCPDDAAEVDLLISNADQAMYASKTSGRNRISYFTRALQDSALNRLTLITDLRMALQNHQFELYFQPIIDLACGRIVKAEALIRWKHPQRGIISPAEFIPLAEETGLIIAIGDWVYRESIKQAKHWHAVLGQSLQVSVNVSPIQFQSDSLNVKEWLSCLQSTGLESRCLSIEITEGLLLNASREVKDKLLQFRDAGIQVAIDDFGVGYSALSYLRRFDIDYLKIDQSFIRNLETEQNDLVLCEAIVIMAHKLGLKVTAEGVETEAQRRLLLEIGCDNGQGYLFSRPLPADEFDRLLMQNRQQGTLL